MNKVFLLIACLCLIATATWQEQPCWSFDGTNWIDQYGLRNAKCRKFLDYDLHGDSCNIERWEIPFMDSLSLAQWIVWSIEGNVILDLVRKPGTFAGIGPIMCVKSNCNVTISFEGFDHLRRIEGCPPGRDSIIEKWYTLTDTTVINPGVITAWIAAPDMDDYTIYIPTSMHEGVSKKIWEKIYVDECNPACEWKDPDGATIVITLEDQKPWIEDSTGLYVTTLP